MNTNTINQNISRLKQEIEIIKGVLNLPTNKDRNSVELNELREDLIVLKAKLEAYENIKKMILELREKHLKSQSKQIQGCESCRLLKDLIGEEK